jgi:hypothetical protein
VRAAFVATVPALAAFGVIAPVRAALTGTAPAEAVPTRAELTGTEAAGVAALTAIGVWGVAFVTAFVATVALVGTGIVDAALVGAGFVGGVSAAVDLTETFRDAAALADADAVAWAAVRRCRTVGAATGGVELTWSVASRDDEPTCPATAGKPASARSGAVGASEPASSEAADDSDEG